MKQHNLPNLNTYGYQVIERLGFNYQGGRATYQALKIDSQEPVVIKQFRFVTDDADWSGYQAVEQEIQVLKNLDHPRIPRYLDAFDSGDGICLVQEYKFAQPLSKSVNFNSKEVKDIAVQVLSILVYLQQHIPPIIHRDIKPENLLIDEESKVYLVDFGLAKIDGDEGIAMSSLVSGTPGFMSPEQVLNLSLTKGTDLYSLGATLICLLTATKSTEVSKLIDSSFRFNFQQLIPQVDDDFLVWLEKMVEPSWENRFADAQAALEVLNNLEIGSKENSQLNRQFLEFKISHLGNKITKNIVITHPKFQQIEQLEKELLNIPAWLSLTPQRSIDNTMEYQVTVDTQQLIPSQFYESQIVFGENSELEPFLLDIKVDTSPFNQVLTSKKLVFFSTLLLTTMIFGVTIALSFTVNLLTATNVLTILSCILFLGLFLLFKFFVPANSDSETEKVFTQLDQFIINVLNQFQQQPLISWLITAGGIALGIGLKIVLW